MRQDKFWTYVDQSPGAESCWAWTGSLNRYGYGQASIEGRTMTASRAAWTFLYGDPGPGLQVCHACDNPRCCNPAHLWLGTAKDNIRDMVAKGRHWTATHPEKVPRGDGHMRRREPERWASLRRLRPGTGIRQLGEQHPGSRLRNSDIAEIRTAYAAGGVTMKALGQRYGVGAPHIHRIVHGQRWSEVQEK